MFTPSKSTSPDQRFKKVIAEQNDTLSVFRKALDRLNETRSKLVALVAESELSIAESEKSIAAEREAIAFLKQEQDRAAASAGKINALIGE